MKKNKLAFIALTLLTLLFSPATAFAAKPTAPGGGGTTTKTPLGIDISWPQCGKQVPTDQAFGIVGVNNGYANETNPCLVDQLVWASKSRGGTVQDKIQLYVNTANPGGYNTPSWPQASSPENPDPSCNGSDSIACAWQYGWNRALEDVRDRFQPAAIQAGISSSPNYKWWLDVETDNTWKLSGSTFDKQSNVAVLEGMTAYFKSVGGRVGIYAYGPQWNQIVGNAVSSSSNLNGLDNWRPGGASQSTAQQVCKTAAPLTAGGKVVLAQFVSKNIDYNLSCI